MIVQTLVLTITFLVLHGLPKEESVFFPLTCIYSPLVMAQQCPSSPLFSQEQIDSIIASAVREALAPLIQRQFQFEEMSNNRLDSIRKNLEMLSECSLILRVYRQYQVDPTSESKWTQPPRVKSLRVYCAAPISVLTH